MTRRQVTPIPDALVIDRAAAVEIPTVEAIQEWAREKRGFMFQCYVGAAEERKAAAAAIRKVSARPAMFEQFGGRDDWFGHQSRFDPATTVLCMTGTYPCSCHCHQSLHP